MRLIALLLALSAAMPAVAQTQAPDRAQLLAQAQHRFAAAAQVREPAQARRQFAAAAADFERLADEAPTPALYLALGNAEALAGRWPHAIWAYESGLRLDPNDATLRNQLDYARARVSYPPGGRGRPVPAAWPRWLPRPGAAAWLLVAAVFHGLAWFAGGWWYLHRRGLLLVVLLLLLAVAAGAGYLLDARQANEDRIHPLAVVAVERTPLQRGNGPSYPLNPDVPNLPAGLEARVLHERGAWLQVRLSTGEVGWVRRSAVLLVAPRAGSRRV